MDKWLLDLLHNLHIPPLYFATFVVLIASLYDIKKLNNWNNLPNYRKNFLITEWIGAIILLLSTIIAFFRIHF